MSTCMTVPKIPSHVYNVFNVSNVLNVSNVFNVPNVSKVAGYKLQVTDCRLQIAYSRPNSFRMQDTG
jgi:hypothetical protein